MITEPRLTNKLQKVLGNNIINLDIENKKEQDLDMVPKRENTDFR